MHYVKAFDRNKMMLHHGILWLILKVRKAHRCFCKQSESCRLWDKGNGIGKEISV